jgi:enoyl-[acyl-carrier-protein] reductase (NADH)
LSRIPNFEISSRLKENHAFDSRVNGFSVDLGSECLKEHRISEEGNVKRACDQINAKFKELDFLRSKEEKATS